MTCELCEQPGGEVVWQDADCRVVSVADEHYPGFCRVIWACHVKEMTDLSVAQQQHLMRVVLATERAVRDLLQPDKVNLASLGNMTPHLHWHVIPRFADDRHFPGAIWAPPVRENMPRSLPIDWQSKLRDALLQHVN
ncbi:diadenosine tetraphosphate (Ap4A) HIT family hydrolase [Chitinivorax tropicus]|uniref:Diadenosine tetraphosphate (Ap4A) HIT family hydrolase n=1 Tax=Chitinivorax tropicus TaxID=714531 RepID=A0A840MIV3_9PROT|nr:diadenosine tetraphosphate (Ap4A) HIT family hydrolase [Chitinivorax tropicus]